MTPIVEAPGWDTSIVPVKTSSKSCDKAENSIGPWYSEVVGYMLKVGRKMKTKIPV
jgi:hypothetical protein